QEGGSSPPARGRGTRPPPSCRRQGIIPASAGKSWPRCPGTWPKRDHPRQRGEEEALQDRAGYHIGSSPPARGRVAPFVDERRLVRIIPASAGKSLPPAASASPARDHPRQRGEESSRLLSCT